MSDVRFNQWLHQSGTGGVSQVSGGHVGIGTTNPEIAVHSGNTKVLNVGIVTASTYYGNGANLTGLPGGGTGLDLNDNIKIRLGNSQDLQLYHDGSHSYIDDAGTGNLRLRSGTLEITNAAGSKTSAVFNSGSSQNLYFNNTKRFETLNDGIRVSGHIYTNDDQYLKLGSSSDFQFYHSSNNNYIKSVGSSQNIIFDVNSGERLRIQSNGNIGINTVTIPSWCKLAINHGQYGLTQFSNHSHLLLQNKNAGNINYWSLAPRDNGSISLARGTLDVNGTVNSTSNSFAISSAGRVGIGTGIQHPSFFEVASTSGTVAYPFATAIGGGSPSGLYAYTPYDHEVTIRNNTLGQTDNFCGLYFEPGAHTDGNRICSARISAIDRGDYRADLTFGTRGYRNGNVRFQEILRLDSNGHAELKTGNLAFASGAGVDFSNVSDTGRSVSSNLLDDYEEGNFTPVLQGSTGSGSATHSYQIGRYTKVGRLVNIFFNVYTTSTASWGGNLRIAGFPYACASAPIEAVAAAQWNQLQGAGSGSSSQSTFAIIQNGNTYCEFRSNKSDNSSFSYLGVQNVNYLRVSMSYYTA